MASHSNDSDPEPPETADMDTRYAWMQRRNQQLIAQAALGANSRPVVQAPIKPYIVKTIGEKPGLYAGGDYTKWKRYIRQMENQFDQNGVDDLAPKPDASKVSYAQTFLKRDSNPDRTWNSELDEHPGKKHTWEEYKQFLLKDTDRASTLQEDVYTKYQRFRQKHQSIQEYSTRRIGLIAQLDADRKPSAVQELDNFRRGLRSSLRKGLKRTGVTYTNKTSMVEQLKNFEDADAMESSEESSKPKKGSKANKKRKRDRDSSSDSEASDSKSDDAPKPKGKGKNKDEKKGGKKSKNNPNKDPIKPKKTLWRWTKAEYADIVKRDACRGCGGLTTSSQAGGKEDNQHKPDDDSSSDESSTTTSGRSSKRRKRQLSVVPCPKVKIKCAGHKEPVTAVLDTGAEVNLISRAFASQLKLIPSEVEACEALTVGRHRLQTYGVYFVRFEVPDVEGTSRFFEESFLGVDLDWPITLGMPWFALSQVTVLPHRGGIGPWPRTTFELLPTMKRIDSIEPEQLAEAALDEKQEVHVMFVRRYTDEHSGLEHVHVQRRAQIGAALQEIEGKPDIKAAIPDILKDYQDMGSEDKAYELPEHGPDDHAIELEPDAKAPYGPIYSLSEDELKVLRAYLDKHLANGFIRPSQSPAGAPILFIKKKNGSLRLCVDYRALNSLTIKNRYPLPLIGESLDRLSKAEMYTSIDLTAAYHRLRIKKGDEWKTAFRTRYGHFEYQVMPFGLTNAPATFQAFINRILAARLDINVIVYLDDIVIYSRKKETHVEDVKWVLDRLRENRLYVALEKCKWFTDSIDFLGFIVSPKGVQMQTSKIEAIQKWPTPKTVSEIQGFLGLANFYRRFIRGFSKIAEPLTAMLKGSAGLRKTGVQKRKRGERSRSRSREPGLPNDFLTADAYTAFKRLRNAFLEAPVLQHFDPAKPIRVETDASDKAIGAILCQPDKDGHWHPVAYFSRKMIPAECNYEVHDKELLAIVYSFRQWRHYLEGARERILVLTDHRNLSRFMTTTKLSPRQVRWAQDLSRYYFVIDYRPGSQNPADGLSRRPDHMVSTEGEVEGNRQILAQLQQSLRTSSEEFEAVRIGAVLALRQLHTGRPCLGAVQTQDTHSSAALEVEGTPRTNKPDVVSEEWKTIVLGSVETTERATWLAAVEHVAKDDAAYNDVPAASLVDLVRSMLAQDQYALTVRTELATPAKPTDWQDTDGVLWYQRRLYIPPALRETVIAANHDNPLAGHFGVERTLELVRRKYHWPGHKTWNGSIGMRKQIKEYCETCAVCKRSKAPRHKPYGELHPLPVPEYKWADLTMDFVTGLPESRAWNGAKYDAILVVMDRLSKMAHYIPCTKTVSAEDLAEILIREVIRLHGLPSSIVTDRGSVFTSKYHDSLCYALKIKLKLSTAYHPQTDGQTERQNSTMEQYLRAFVNFEQNDWVELLPMAEFAYNNSKHASTGYSPFEIIQGYSPRMSWEEPPDWKAKSKSAKEHAKHLADLLQVLRANLLDAQAAQTKYKNAHTKLMKFNVGDYVNLNGKNIRTKRNKKLEWKLFGPFKILQRIGDQAYRLELPSRWRIHDVFHVSLLEGAKSKGGQSAQAPKKPSYQPGDIEIEEDEEATEELYEVAAVKDSRIFKAGQVPDRSYSEPGLYYQVEWEDYEELTWEPVALVKHLRGMLREFHDKNPKKPDASQQTNRRRPRQQVGAILAVEPLTRKQTPHT